MRLRTRLVLAAAVIAVPAALPLLAQGTANPPIARYDMRAGTVSGMGAMAGGGMGAAMSMIFGGGGSKLQHELYLRLGSSRGPDKGAPKADHFMPAGARLGKSVALVTPTAERGPADQLPGEREGRRPTGRILIYWGCGEHAPKGQPVIIDLATLGGTGSARAVVGDDRARLGADAAEQQDVRALAGRG